MPGGPVPIRLGPQMCDGAALEVSVQHAAQAQQGVRKGCTAWAQMVQLLQGQQATLQAAHTRGCPGGRVPGKKAKVPQQPGQGPAQVGWGYDGCGQVGFCIHQGDEDVAGVTGTCRQQAITLAGGTSPQSRVIQVACRQLHGGPTAGTSGTQRCC